MIKHFIECWESNKDMLENWFANTEVGMISCGGYALIMQKIIELVFNHRKIKGEDHSTYTNFRELDFGDYQGTKIFVFTRNTYQPASWDTYFTYVEYGSCECCDLLLGICDYKDEAKPNKKQIDAFMKLALNMVQHIGVMNKLGDEEDE